MTGAGKRWLAASMRLTSAVGPIEDGRLAAGLRARPFQNVPVQIALERRFGLSSGVSDDSAAYVYGGVGPLAAGAGVEVEAYGQGGAVLGDDGDATVFADGQLHALKPLMSHRGKTLSIGAGMWGGVQDEDWRLDAGPRIEARLPVAERQVRLSVDWRQRIGGNVRPASGVALTLSGGF